MAKPSPSVASSPSASSTASSSSSLAGSATRSTGLLIDRRKRLAANARERKRMHLLNKAYDELRQRLIDADNKSKYDVLVQAKEYIQALASICQKFDQQQLQIQRQQATGATTKLEQIAPVDMTAKLASREQLLLKGGQMIHRRHLGYQLSQTAPKTAAYTSR